MNASDPPPNLAEQHAATLARLLVLLDQLLCAIGDRARLPWYARILVPARATRACQAWGEGFRRDIATMGEKIRDGAYDDDTYWDATYWDDAYWDAEDWDAAKWDATCDAHDAAHAGEKNLFMDPCRAALPDGAEAAGDPPEPCSAAERFARDDDNDGAEAPDAKLAQADPPVDGRSANARGEIGATVGTQNGRDRRPGFRSGGGVAGRLEGRWRAPDGPRSAMRLGMMRCRAGPGSTARFFQAAEGRDFSQLFRYDTITFTLFARMGLAWRLVMGVAALSHPTTSRTQ